MFLIANIVPMVEGDREVTYIDDIIIFPETILRALWKPHHATVEGDVMGLPTNTSSDEEEREEAGPSPQMLQKHPPDKYPLDGDRQIALNTTVGLM
ncbi:UNVERIFIED_CONTAM: hypothetical protein K2H54_058338 [Gekko kuhli]